MNSPFYYDDFCLPTTPYPLQDAKTHDNTLHISAIYAPKTTVPKMFLYIRRKPFEHKKLRMQWAHVQNCPSSNFNRDACRKTIQVLFCFAKSVSLCIALFCSVLFCSVLFCNAQTDNLKLNESKTDYLA